jgi:hypothetical protein
MPREVYWTLVQYRDRLGNASPAHKNKRNYVSLISRPLLDLSPIHELGPPVHAQKSIVDP